MSIVFSHFKDNVVRVDPVCDVYRDLSTKGSARELRTCGKKTKTAVKTTIKSRDMNFPKNWAGFFSLTHNKRELVRFLCDEIMSKSKELNKTIVVNGGVDGYAESSNPDILVEHLQPKRRKTTE